MNFLIRRRNRLALFGHRHLFEMLYEEADTSRSAINLFLERNLQMPYRRNSVDYRRRLKAVALGGLTSHFELLGIGKGMQ
jgi:hypothetical protein